MDDLEEALKNIDVFCRELVRKMVEDESKENSGIVEPIEALFRKKYIREEPEPSPSRTHLIPLPQLEEPLIDVFDEEDRVKVIMQLRCKDEEATVRSDTDGIKICKKVCRTDSSGSETCETECKGLDLPTDKLKTENMTARCNNNQVLEVDIPKEKL